MARYKVLIKPSAAKEIEAVDQKKDRQSIVAHIRSLGDEPRPHGSEKLAGESERYRFRVGRYRVIYSIEDRDLLVFVVRVAHRKDIYRWVAEPAAAADRHASAAEPQAVRQPMRDRDAQAREIMKAIGRVLLEDWDPIGVKDEPEAQDEYDGYVGGVYRLLA